MGQPEIATAGLVARLSPLTYEIWTPRSVAVAAYLITIHFRVKGPTPKKMNLLRILPAL